MGLTAPNEGMSLTVSGTNLLGMILGTSGFDPVDAVICGTGTGAFIRLALDSVSDELNLELFFLFVPGHEKAKNKTESKIAYFIYARFSGSFAESRIAKFRGLLKHLRSYPGDEDSLNS
jgi:hypothetical protein